MNFFLSLIAFFMSLILGAQTAFYNFGELKLHDKASIGFHTDLVNDGNLDNNNKGLVLFYSDNDIINISGKNRVIFNDVKIDAINDIELYNSLGIANDLKIVNGRIFTPKDGNISLDFINHNVNTGESDQRYIDGYITVTGSTDFSFPIGSNNSLKTMILTTKDTISTFKGTYFPLDPNHEPYHYYTSQKQIFIENVSTKEFWDLDGSSDTKVTLTWKSNDDIKAITSDINLLKVLGWDESKGKWMDLGQSKVSGNIHSGKVTSNSFIPDHYKAITLGSEISAVNTIGKTNLIITPNGDLHNETLTFDGLDELIGNKLTIYNRWGKVVYEAVDYQNDWRGESSDQPTIIEDKFLPVGTYFYSLKMVIKIGSSLLKTGWIYIQK